VVPAERILTVDLDGAVVVSDGAVEVALGGIGVAAIVEGAGVIGAELEGLAVVLDSFVVVVLVVPEDAAIVIRDGKVMAAPAAGLDLPRTGGYALLRRRVVAVADLLVLFEGLGCGGSTHHPDQQGENRNERCPGIHRSFS